MAGSVPISQLPPNPTITIDDFIAIVDSGSLSTQRTSVGTVNTFFASSGSNLSSSFASMSISVSFAIYADSASYVYPITYEMTASWTENLDSGSVAGTASLAYNAKTASRLEGIGTSYENDLAINTSLTINDGAYVQTARQPELTSSVVIPQIKHNSIFLHKNYTNSSSYGKVFLNDSQSYKAKVVFDLGGQFVNVSSIGPDIDTIAKGSKGILFQADHAGSGGNEASSVLYARENGRTYTRYVEALEYSSSKFSLGEGFHGTASYALFSSQSLSSPTQWPLGTIVGFAGLNSQAVASPAWANWTGSHGQPFDNTVFPDLATQITNSYCLSASVSMSWIRGSTNVNNAISMFIDGGSGIFSASLDHSASVFINAVAGYTHVFTGLTLATHSVAVIDYGYKDPSPTITVTGAPHALPSLNHSGSIHRFGDRAFYRLPQMQPYFRTYTSISPLTWLILQMLT